MTLIAQLSVNGAPFLVGDVLLSSECRRGLKVNLPLVGDINQILADRGLPFEVSFAQKINVFNGRLAVAFSGSALQAERALRVLEAISSRENLQLNDIEAELNAIDHSAIDQLQLLIFLLRGVHGTTVEASLVSFGVDAVDIPDVGKVYAAGTGRDAFLEILQRARQSSGKGDEYQVAHSLLGALTNHEFRLGNTIVNRWGGGFEALTFSLKTQRLEKVGDVLHTFWKASEYSGGAIEMLPYFYKTTYWRDALIIRSASLDVSTGMKLKTNDLNLIPPLLKDISDYSLAEVGRVDFSYRAVCCHVLIEKPNGRDIMFLIDQKEAGQDVVLDVNQSTGRLHVTDYLPSIINEQLRLFRTTASRAQKP